MPDNTALRRARLASAVSAFNLQQDGVGSEAGMKVSTVRAFSLREPVSRRSYTVLKVATESGVVGFGECEAVSSAELAKAIQTVVGKPATAYEVIRQQLHPLPGLQAALNMALLDILGKIVKAPIYQVLGGPTRFKVRASTALIGETDEALLTSMKRAQSAGFRAFLVPVPRVQAPNQGQAFVRATRKRLDSLKAAGGDTADFILDGAGLLSAGDASTLAHELERFHLLWFDQPCRLSNLTAARKVASECVTPLGFGHPLHDTGDFQDLLRDELIDVLRPNLALNGISQIRKMAALAEAYYVAVAPYHNGGPVASAAALHLAASLPNFFIQQIPLPAAEQDRKMRSELAGSSLERVTEGFAALPPGAGLGMAVSEDALEKYRERSA
jgi:galactonate dehydratase